MLLKMAEALRLDSGNRIELWNDPYAALCRVGNPAVDTGCQPIVSADGRLSMFFFGECFGYEARKRELAARGHAFAAEQCDAEYAMRLFEQYGEAAFRLLSGSFCIALYDARERSLRLVSDRLGSRPIFYGTSRDGRIAFASRVSSLLHDPGIDGELNAAAVLEFCALQKVLGFKTYHLGVSMLPPASMLCFRDGAARLSRYWTPHYDPRAGTIGQFAEELAETIKAAMKEVGRGSERVGVLLSGGLDARMMVAAAGQPLTCYCFGDYENPEYETAKQVAAARGFDIRLLRRQPDHYVDMLDRAVELGSGMHPFNHAHALGFVERIAKESQVVTHGYGIEALFRGTTLPKEERSFLGFPLGTRLDPTLNESNLPARYYRRAYSMQASYPGLFSPGAVRELDASIEESAKQIIADATPHCTSVYDKLLWSDVFARCRYTGYLFLLSLRPYVRERSVLFSNSVIDLHLQVPVVLRSDNRLWIKAMAQLDREIAGIVNANTGCSPRAPAAWVAAAEFGRSLVERLTSAAAPARRPGPEQEGASPRSWPRFDWMIRNNVRLRALITETLRDPEALPPSIFDLGQVGAVLGEHLSGRAHHRDVLFALLTFGRWHKRHVAGR